jgi:hypothetical protein
MISLPLLRTRTYDQPFETITRPQTSELRSILNTEGSHDLVALDQRVSHLGLIVNPQIFYAALC